MFSIQSSYHNRFQSLELEFQSHFIQNVDFNKETGFGYLKPNEGSPEGNKPHLKQAAEGIMVSTGTERSFFNLRFSDPSKCQGLVVIDVTPKVKAYVDFNTLLLRISDSREEYVKLSAFIQNQEDFDEAISIIREKTINSDISTQIKKYYLKNLVEFGSVYLKTRKQWRDGGFTTFFEKSRYDLCEKRFAKLQNYAKSGNIISTTRDINDLTFLSSRKVAIVDTSNIHHYSILTLKGGNNFSPRVIWTLPNKYKTTYYSYTHQALDEEQSNELKGLIEEIKNLFEMFKNDTGWKFKIIAQDNLDINAFESVNKQFYSIKTLNALKHFINNNTLEIPGHKTIQVPKFDEIDKKPIAELNYASDEQLKEICKTTNIKLLAKSLVECWKVLEPRLYLSFMNIEGWKEAFEDCFMWTPLLLDRFLVRVDDAGLLHEFIEQFGKQRLCKLYGR